MRQLPPVDVCHLADLDTLHSTTASPPVTLCGRPLKGLSHARDPYDATCPLCRAILKRTDVQLTD